MSSLRQKIWAYTPLALILAAMLLVYFSGIYHELSFQEIKAKHAEWKAAIHEHPVQSAAYFVIIYILSVCLVIPDSTLLTLLAGLLFPFPLATFLVVLSETVGATLFFGATRLAFLHAPLSYNRPALLSFKTKMIQHPASYLLFFRISHLLPFWLINLIAAFLNIRVYTFIWTTFIGVLPLSLVFIQGGAGLSHYLESNQTFHIAAIFNTQVKLALLGFAILSLIPVFIARYRKD